MNMKATIEDLKTLTGYTDRDPVILQATAAKTLPWQEEVTQIFYDTLYGYSPTRAVFSDDERPAREKTLANWYSRVARGEIDDAFWEWQWFVGLVHIKRGISNSFMLGMMSRVQLVFRANCFEAFPPEKAEVIFGAFKRVTDIIAGLIAEGYFESYVLAMEKTSGQSRILIDRMVGLEVDDMIQQARSR